MYNNVCGITLTTADRPSPEGGVQRPVHVFYRVSIHSARRTCAGVWGEGERKILCIGRAN